MRTLVEASASRSQLFFLLISVLLQCSVFTKIELSESPNAFFLRITFMFDSVLVGGSDDTS